MANCITLNNKIILRCSNCAMSFFYENMMATALNNGFNKNKKLMEFLEKLDQNMYGLGCVELEITEAIDSIEVAKLFQKLVSKTADKIKSDKSGSPDSIERFENFNIELSKWAPDKNI